jgi:serine/threonine protein phosphatase PrpC
LLTPEQAARHSLSHVLDRALGVDEELEVDVHPDDILEEGDALVLCTDGLYGVVDNKVIAWAAANHSGEQAADILLKWALAAPARDNTSVIVLRVGDPDPAERWSLDN